MKKILAIVAVITLSAVMVSSPAEARRGWGGGGYERGYYDPTTWQGLNLTVDQVNKLRTMRELYIKEITPLHNELISKSGELRLLWLQNPPDQKKIVAKQNELRALRDQLTDKQTAYRFEALKVLTPEQLSKVQLYGHVHDIGYGPRGRR